MRYLTAALSFVIACNAIANEPIRFEGRKVTDPVGEYQITGMGKHDAVVYVDLKNHFSLVLPYSEAWEFWRNPAQLTAHAGLYNVSVEMLPDQSATDQEYLETVASALLSKKDANGTETAKVREAGGRPVLGIIADAEALAKEPRFKGIKQYSFITSRVSKGVRFRYQLSLLDAENKGSAAASSLLKYVVNGFQAGVK